MVIATDGEENSSKEFPGKDGKAKIKAMVVRQQEDYHWEFTYIGANVDSFAEAASYGIAGVATLDYTTAGTAQAWSGTSSAATRFSSGRDRHVTYTSEERDAAKGKQ